MNFDEMILEAAKSIANATSALIKAASEAQKELVAQGKVSKKTHIGSEDGKVSGRRVWCPLPAWWPPLRTRSARPQTASYRATAARRNLLPLPSR